MALNNVSNSPPNGAVKQSGADDDLEDGEIFDDDEPVEVFKGGGFEDLSKPPAPETPPKEQTFKQNKSGCSGGDRKKGQKDRDKRSNSKERRADKRADRSNSRNNSSGAKRKRGRDTEDDHRPSKSKQRKVAEKNKPNQPMEDEVDENEMVYVMGGNSPTSSKQVPDWEMFSDEEEMERDKDNDRGGGGGGRGSRRGREGFHSSGRMSRRARLSRGGAKRNRFPRKQNNDLTICKFFMQGKCQRGNDCPFSHTALPSKKMELCKFYMNDCCTKRDKCLYMHGDFPCKFYHTGQKCYAGKRCKFYHGKISNFLRSVLMKHLENRELQKEFDKYSEMYEKKDRDRGRDRDRFPDRRRSRSDEEEGGSTPMPSPQRDEFASDSRERSPTPEREREKRERRRRRAKRRSREEEEKNREYYEDPEYYEDDVNEQPRNDNEYEGWTSHHQQYNNYQNQNYDENDEFANDEYPEEDVDPLPANMPATQRKLFMRIQQQQQNKQSNEHADNETREEEFKEENWYSSDEENANNPLNTIFRNVPGLNQMQQSMKNPMQPTPLMSAPMQPPNQMMNNPIQPPNPMMNNPIPPPPNPMMNNPPMQNNPMMNNPPMQNNPMMNNPPMQNNPMMNQCPPMNQPPMPLMAPLMNMPQNIAPMSNTMFDNIDLSAVSKILSTVRESMKINSDNSDRTPPPTTVRNDPRPSNSPTNNQPQQDERRFRDPRLRGQEGSDRNKGTSSSSSSGSSKPSLSAPVLLTQADLDLRLSDPPPQHSLEAAGSDVDLRHLPFKPAPLHQAANEIDASISSGPPIEWKLSILAPFKPDYSVIASRSNPQTCANDPRLRKYATPQVLAQSQMVVAQALPSGQTRMMSPPQGSRGLSPPQNQTVRTEEPAPSRDPRNRGVANDPRRRNQPAAPLLIQAQNPPQQPPPPQQAFAPQQFGGIRPVQQSYPPNQMLNPILDQQQSPRHDNDFRLGILSQIPQLSSLVLPNMSDIDLRVQQPHYYK